MAKIKPIYKLNNGNGATLCNTCKIVISEGFTEDLYCKKCDSKQETLKEALLELRKTPMTFEPKQETLEEVKDLSYYKTNAEEDYSKVPISVLRYISELEQTKEIGQIAEEFAIGFLNWYAMYGSWIEENLTTKELLEIYKKEKGL